MHIIKRVLPTRIVGGMFDPVILSISAKAKPRFSCQSLRIVLLVSPLFHSFFFTMIRRALNPLRPLDSLPSLSPRHAHIRHASLNSAIERGIRKSRTEDGFESRRYGNNGYSGKRRGEYGDSASRRYERDDRFHNRGKDFGGFASRRNDTDQFGNRRRESKSRKDREEMPPIEDFDPDEFIRTGILPSHVRTQVGSNANKGNSRDGTRFCASH